MLGLSDVKDENKNASLLLVKLRMKAIYHIFHDFKTLLNLRHPRRCHRIIDDCRRGREASTHLLRDALESFNKIIPMMTNMVAEAVCIIQDYTTFITFCVYQSCKQHN